MPNMHVTNMPPLTIAGLFVKTTCTDGAAKPAIKQLWRKVIREKQLDTLANKINNDLYAIYLFNHPTTPHIYTFIIGHSVSSAENISKPFGIFTLDEGRYLHSDTTSGTAPEIIVQT